MAVLIKHGNRYRLHTTINLEGGQAIFVWVNGALFASCYCALNEHVMQLHADVAAQVSALGHSVPWLIGADWNAELDENPTFIALDQVESQLLGVQDSC